MQTVTALILDDSDIQRKDAHGFGKLSFEAAKAATAAHLVVWRDEVLKNRTGQCGRILPAEETSA